MKSIFEHTQPNNTEVTIAGAGKAGPDIIYMTCINDKQVQVPPTVQVKAVEEQPGFNRGMKLEVRPRARQIPSDVLAVQVPDRVTDVSSWRYRYWNSERALASKPAYKVDDWEKVATASQHREILIVNESGTVLFRGPMYEPGEMSDPYGRAGK